MEGKLTKAASAAPVTIRRNLERARRAFLLMKTFVPRLALDLAATEAIQPIRRPMTRIPSVDELRSDTNLHRQVLVPWAITSTEARSTRTCGTCVPHDPATVAIPPPKDRRRYPTPRLRSSDDHRSWTASTTQACLWPGGEATPLRQRQADYTLIRVRPQRVMRLPRGSRPRTSPRREGPRR